ncbi:hypothetical protein IWW48_005061 [Coemansia sp. RSA 1200]|nr:hypothetical protein IWW48_005061 [Coemansia sp. RSA 1200]
MSLSHEGSTSTEAAMPSNTRLSSILGGPSDTSATTSERVSAQTALQQPQSTALPPVKVSPDSRQRHTRSPSSSSGSYTHTNQAMTPPPPPLTPHNRANTGGVGTSQYHHSAARNSATNSSPTPPRIRQTRSEAHPAHGGHGSPPKLISGQAGDDPSKNNNYSLWLPWEETALIDWLYEPTNCRLFNEPRRKKECHERIIREILPSKTSRAIEGKIRTLEKRYLKAAGEIQREDFVTAHPGKRAEDVAEALCNNFYKLETIFNPSLISSRGPQSQFASAQNKRKFQWGNKSIGSSGHTVATNATDGSGGVASQMPPAPDYDHGSGTSQAVVTSNAVGSHGSGNSSISNGGSGKAGSNTNNHSSTSTNSNTGLSVPRGSPPMITATESLPLPYRMMAFSRKIAPKRDTDNANPTEGADIGGDVPAMMSASKRSRTFPAMMQNRRSPVFNPVQSKQTTHPLTMDLRNVNNAYHVQQHQKQHPQQHPQQQQQLLHQQQQQQQQQQRYYENGLKYTYEASSRPSTATLPMMPIASPMGGGSQAVPPQPTSASSAIPLQHYPQPVTPSLPNNNTITNTTTTNNNTTTSGGAFQDTNEHSHARSVSISAVQGTREELEWLQFNLRREELEFRKSVFAQEQELETKRVRLEERRLDIKRHELELEGKRVDMQQRQVDLQLETMKSMSTMLSQMTKQMGNMLGAASTTNTRALAASGAAAGEDANSAIEQQDSLLE